MEKLNITLPKLLSELVNDIKKCFDNSTVSQKTMEDISGILYRFGQEKFIACLKEINCDKGYLEKIACNSYLHENGFYKINLYTSNDFTIRFHIWEHSVEIKETLHDHRWFFASTVLNGSLKSEIWQYSPSAQASEYDEYLYIDKNTNPIRIGSSRVEYVKTVVRNAGEKYTLSPDVLHRIISSGSEMTATLFCRSTVIKSTARNIIVNDKVPNVIPQYFTLEKLSSIIDEYVIESQNNLHRRIV
ncbi:MAG: hypothetical protein K2X50_00975 [Gammaproteobacteria bacterium]|nr:hypothetical protein [Gammaproteobacteria bacterium]